MSNSPYNAGGNPFAATVDGDGHRKPHWQEKTNDVPLGYQQRTVSGTAVGLSSTSIPAGTRFAVVIPSAPVRWRDDGTDPTASVGMPLAANQPWIFSAANGSTGASLLSQVKLIRQTTDATIDVAFYA